jgi:hypothetical protein
MPRRKSEVVILMKKQNKCFAISILFVSFLGCIPFNQRILMEQSIQQHEAELKRIAFVNKIIEAPKGCALISNLNSPNELMVVKKGFIFHNLPKELKHCQYMIITNGDFVELIKLDHGTYGHQEFKELNFDDFNIRIKARNMEELIKKYNNSNLGG